MNNRSFVLPLILGLVLSTAAVVAQQQPSAASRVGTVATTSSAPASEPATFLGAMTVPAPRALTSPLGLPAGMGLVVVAVQPDSPAASALKVDDILVRLDDQMLIEVNQLAVLVRSHREGDEVTLTYLRSGQEAQAKVRLAKRAALVSVTQVNVGGGGGGTSMFASSNADGTKIVYTDVNGIIELNTAGGRKSVVVKSPEGAEIFSGPFDTDAERAAVPVAVRIRIESVEQRVTQQRVARSLPAWYSTTRSVDGSRMSFGDPSGRIVEINIVDGHKTIVAKNPDGTVAFSGPFDTEAERAAAPVALRTRVEEFEKRETARDAHRSSRVRIGYGAGGSIGVATVAGRKTIVVRDPDGTEIFSGPFDTEAERAAAPVDVRTRVEEVEKRTGVAIWMDIQP